MICQDIFYITYKRVDRTPCLLQAEEAIRPFEAKIEEINNFVTI